MDYQYSLHPPSQEFMKLTEFAECGSIKDRLAWAFKVYDKDMSGMMEWHGALKQ